MLSGGKREGLCEICGTGLVWQFLLFLWFRGEHLFLTERSGFKSDE